MTHRFFALLALPALAASQQAPVTLPEITLTGAPETAYGVASTSTATRAETLLRDTPQAITVLPRAGTRCDMIVAARSTCRSGKAPTCQTAVTSTVIGNDTSACNVAIA